MIKRMEKTFTYYKKEFPLLSEDDLIRVNKKDIGSEFYIIREIRKKTLYIVDEIIHSNEFYTMGSKSIEFNLRRLHKTIESIEVLNKNSIEVTEESVIPEENWHRISWWWNEDERLASLYINSRLPPGNNYNCTEILCLLEAISEYHIPLVESCGPFAEMVVKSSIFWQKKIGLPREEKEKEKEKEKNYMFYHYTHNISFYVNVLDNNLNIDSSAYRTPRDMASPLEIPITRYGKQIKEIYIALLRTKQIVSFVEKPSVYLIETGAIIDMKCINLSTLIKEKLLTFFYE